MAHGKLDVAEFEQHRPRLNAIALGMLGSHADANDALQQVWIRTQRTDATTIDNIAAWLTTITARVALNMLRTRRTRREDPFDNVIIDHVLQPSVDDTVETADVVSVALLIVLETLTPAERLAFVLHDLFAIPFDDIGQLLDRSPAAARQLASRARRRVQGADLDATLARTGEHRRIVDAFFAAARGGDLDELVRLLDPQATLHVHLDEPRRDPEITVHGARNIAQRAATFARPDAQLVPIHIRAHAGVLVTISDRPVTLMAFTITNERITHIDVLNGPQRLAELTPPGLRRPPRHDA